MQWAYDLGGGDGIVVKKYQIGEAMATAGVPVLKPTLSGTDGLLLASTTAAADLIGVTLDAHATRNTAQTGLVDNAVYVSVIINPNGIFRARLSGGATTGTAISTTAETVASTTGLIVTNAPGTDYDDGVIWGYDGANAGYARKIEVGDATDANLTIALPFDTAVGDLFLMATTNPGDDAGVQLTSALDEVDATAENHAGVNFRVVEGDLRDKGGEGTTKSYFYLKGRDYMFGPGA